MTETAAPTHVLKLLYIALSINQLNGIIDTLKYNMLEKTILLDFHYYIQLDLRGNMLVDKQIKCLLVL